jgi:membrane protein DedA with SNARE-associated domain
MSTAGLILFTVAFVALGTLYGDYYEKLHISRDIWIAVTVAAGAVFIAEYIYTALIKKEKEN